MRFSAALYVLLGVVLVAACVGDDPRSVPGANDSGAPAADASSPTMLPDAATPPSDASADAASASPFVDVAISVFAGCALRVDGSVWCWGANTFGQLGTSDVGAVRPVAERVPGPMPPMVAITAGTAHFCGLTGNHEVWCWGTNTRGESGHDPANDRDCSSLRCNEVPQKVAGILARDVVGLDAATCAVSVDNDVYCWGRGDTSLLGSGFGRDAGPSAQSDTPVLVEGLDARGHVGAVGGGSWPGGAACATIVPAGEVRCWGTSVLGNLGHEPGTANDRSDGERFYNAVPHPIATPGGPLRGVTTLSGSTTFCALGADSAQLACWGGNGCGQLAAGGFASDAGGAIEASPPFAELALQVSVSNAACAILTTKEVRCWGDDTGGIVGSTTSAACVPNDVATGIGTAAPRVQPNLRANRISVSRYAAAVVDDSGRVLAWGQNQLGVLGHAPGELGDDPAALFRNTTPHVVVGL